MKLSTAMRKGNRMTRCERGHMFRGMTHACALGAALVGALGKRIMMEENNTDFTLALSRFDVLDTMVRCPACTQEYTTRELSQVITHLNDMHRWPRSLTANWVEKIEKEVVKGK